MEFDGESWRKRRWLEVYSLQRRAFLVEHHLVLAERKLPEISERIVQWPAIVSKSDFTDEKESIPSVLGPYMR